MSAEIAARASAIKSVPPAGRSWRRQVIDAFDGWVAAAAEAREAYDAWRATPGRVAFTVYRAAQDRADAAQDRLANTIRVTGSQGRDV